MQYSLESLWNDDNVDLYGNHHIPYAEPQLIDRSQAVDADGNSAFDSYTFILPDGNRADFPSGEVAIFAATGKDFLSL